MKNQVKMNERHQEPQKAEGSSGFNRTGEDVRTYGGSDTQPSVPRDGFKYFPETSAPKKRSPQRVW